MNFDIEQELKEAREREQKDKLSVNRARLGKARRKCLAAIYDRMTGSVRTISDGEADDAPIDVYSRTVSETPVAGPAGPVSAADFMGGAPRA